MSLAYLFWILNGLYDLWLFDDFLLLDRNRFCLQELFKCRLLGLLFLVLKNLWLLVFNHLNILFDLVRGWLCIISINDWM